MLPAGCPVAPLAAGATVVLAQRGSGPLRRQLVLKGGRSPSPPSFAVARSQQAAGVAEVRFDVGCGGELGGELRLPRVNRRRGRCLHPDAPGFGTDREAALGREPHAQRLARRQPSPCRCSAGPARAAPTGSSRGAIHRTAASGASPGRAAGRGRAGRPPPAAGCPPRSPPTLTASASRSSSSAMPGFRAGRPRRRAASGRGSRNWCVT